MSKNNKIKYDRNNMLLLCYAMHVVILGSPQISDVYKTVNDKLLGFIKVWFLIVNGKIWKY